MSEPNPQFLSWLLDRHYRHGAVTEIRALRPHPDGGQVIYSGYFGPDDFDGLCRNLSNHGLCPRSSLPRGAQPRSGEANLYFSMQGVSPEKVRGTSGWLVPTRTTSRDADIHAYGLFAVDVDPIRPSGLSATAGEKSAAITLAGEIREWFNQRGVHPVMADSGNGVHLLIPVQPKFGADVAQASIQAHLLLKLLSERFSNDVAKVDTAIFNPSRILKLYGTLAMKGVDSEERPHRVSAIDWRNPPQEVDLFEILGSDIAAYKESLQGPSTSPVLLRRRIKETEVEAAPPTDSTWREWRERALAKLPLEQIYGPYLTGKLFSSGWLQCRDPESPSGDQHPSAGVAAGHGHAERGSFHSFRSGESLSVFDYLYRYGLAEDFDDARQLVAELSGVPQPRRKSPRKRLDPDNKEGVAKGDDQSFPLSSSFPERITVDFITNTEPITALFDRILDAILPLSRLFATESGMVWVTPGRGPCPITDRILPGLLSGHIDIRYLKAVGDETRLTRYAVFPFELARTFVADPRIHSRLPKLSLYTRTPLFLDRWMLCATRGYNDIDGGVWYDGPDIPPSEPGSPHLKTLLEGFPWQSPIDRINALGVMLTAITLPLWGRGHPFIAINGNRPGCGKTTLARVMGILAEGRDPATVTFTTDDAELEKQLATRVECGDRFIILDNVKASGPLSSPVLERSITDGRPSFRRLGSNTTITRPSNDLLFCLTMNNTALGPDLLRRALPISLILDGDPRRATYATEDIVGYALDHRGALLGELVTMVNSWLDAGKPVPAGLTGHSAGQGWARAIGAMLHHNGCPGFLSNLGEAERAFDPGAELMEEIAAHFATSGPAFAAEWVERLEDCGLNDLFFTRTGRDKSRRGKATAVGQLFASRVGQRFTAQDVHYEFTRELPRGRGWKALYGFKPVT